ncbi:hypothetical protein E5161_09840 [Cohnella pontilimi]|uniref:SLH domain-containing protein n=1 Tax=Cohnella pontilimi TaxID=2564100 RepID=A0A4U0FC46_9BACL|nr:S-layer homology domain-containing protein [Cohnella pontilimi]TJY42291.1 hypothetical protein E5161_09840 [Cohnella pontilimi]
MSPIKNGFRIAASISLIICLAVGLLPGAAFAAPSAGLVTDKSVYHPGDPVEVQFKLDGFEAGAKMNSATFRFVYDASAFEPAASQIKDYFVDGTIKSAAKTDSTVPGTITYLVANQEADYPVVNGSTLFTVKLKVRLNASAGIKTFVLKGDNQDRSMDILDSKDHVYHVSSATASVTIAGSTGDGGPPPVPASPAPVELPPILLPNAHLTGNLPFVSLQEAMKIERIDGAYVIRLDASLAASLIRDMPEHTRILTVGIDIQDPAVFVIPSSAAKLAADKIGLTGSILVLTKTGSFMLPLSVLQANAGFDDNAEIRISIVPAGSEPADQLKTAALNENITLLPAPAVAYSLSIINKGVTRTIQDFDRTFVSRSISLGKIEVNPDRASVFMLRDGQRLSPVPTRFFTASDGTVSAVLQRTGNSTYAVGYKNPHFKDLTGHWAQSAINQLASKGIVSGKSASAFHPNDPISRAEFASLLVRALGLYDKKAPGAFKDIQANDWYNQDVLIASQAGLVSGYNGRFHPNHPISRQEMAVMAVNAIKYVDPNRDAGKTDLSRFADVGRSAVWAKEAIQFVVSKGIMSGLDTRRFDPLGTSTRAQAAVILLKTLQYLEFID